MCYISLLQCVDAFIFQRNVRLRLWSASRFEEEERQRLAEREKRIAARLQAEKEREQVRPYFRLPWCDETNERSIHQCIVVQEVENARLAREERRKARQAEIDAIMKPKK
jgi:hypothetical protein